MREELLLMSAAEVLSTAPAASMEDIAAAAGISRATLFRRYPNRQVLVAAVARAAAEAYVTAIDAARLDDGPPDVALRRLIGALAPLGVRFGLLTSQPLDELVEQELLALVRDSDERLRALVRRGQEEGVFRVDLTAEWVVIMVTWLLVGGADGVRLGQLAAREVERLVAETVLGALRRPPRRR
ncbi:TetR/AcrR family transcriptional regulator [Modestobacter marinus]|uniref:TetR/AcrR family transcriptional regulator n=1 Tax=Modestobacter marinus TaxID=477641 RepID=UPI001C958EB4|nr:TetR/AcrR family transcriptional regulator [Modestobacter marinus]